MVWSASEDGTLRQHDFREGTSCPPVGSSHQECRNVLVRLALHDNTYLSFISMFYIHLWDLCLLKFLYYLVSVHFGCNYHDIPEMHVLKVGEFLLVDFI